MKRTLIIPFLLVSICVFAEDVTPYFTTPEMPNALRYLPAPPKTNEMRYAYDTAQYQWGKSVRNTPRGQKARLDAAYSVQRMAEIFSPIMGVAISKTNTPQLWKLLTDATKTTSFACDSAKIIYMRKRPYMVFHEPTLVPEDEEELSHNGSYPSGHAAQDALLKEGFEYGQSRVIAGFHWQSDVDAARVVASAAFAKLHTSKAYLKQLKKAQKEFRCKKHANIK